MIWHVLDLQESHCTFITSGVNGSCRRRAPDDSLVFSLDFPVHNPKDSYRIEHNQDSDSLTLTDKKRICDYQGPTLAVAVSPQRVRDIAMLGRDGNSRFKIF